MSVPVPKADSRLAIPDVPFSPQWLKRRIEMLRQAPALSRGPAKRLQESKKTHKAWGTLLWRAFWQQLCQFRFSSEQMLAAEEACKPSVEKYLKHPPPYRPVSTYLHCSNFGDSVLADL